MSNQGGKMNPTNRQGRIMQCFKCNSAKHFAKDCYDSNSKNNVKCHCWIGPVTYDFI